MECKNCHQKYKGSYCSNCGQKNNLKRLDVKYLREEIARSIFQLERGLLFTIKELATRPGHAIREFIEGKRIPHFKPLSFLLIATTLYVIANKVFGNTTFINQAIAGFNNYEESNVVASNSVEADIFKWLTNYQTYVILLTTLIFSIASYIAFFKSGYNFIEHLVLNFYISGLQFLIYTFFSFFNFDEDSIFVIAPLGLGFLFNLWSFFQFFSAKRLPTKVVLLLLTYILFFVGIVIVALMIALIGQILNGGL